MSKRLSAKCQQQSPNAVTFAEQKTTTKHRQTFRVFASINAEHIQAIKNDCFLVKRPRLHLLNRT
jgi:hypothetical protein